MSSQVHPSVREVAVLQQATQMILSSLDADTVFHHMLLVARNYFGASRCAVYLVDTTSNELYCRAQNGYEQDISQRRLAIGKESVAGWAAFTRAPLYVPDVGKEPRHHIEDPGVNSVLAIPLLVRERTVGVLEISSNQPDSFSSDAIGLLSVFAGQAAIALENSRLYFTDLRRMRQIEIINLIARSAAAASDTQQFFTMLVDLVSDTFEGTMIAVVLFSNGQVSVEAHSGVKQIDPDRFVASRRSGVLAESYSQRSLSIINDIAARPNWPACFPDSGSELCAPLVSLGEALGAIVLGHPQANHFTQDDRAIAQAAADVCATAARNVQLSEELQRVATIDPLTGLYNQRHFHSALVQEISRARRHKKEFGLLMLDLRGFREINSALGMEKGDELLRRAGTALRSTMRNNDMVCRYVGDRFAMLLPEVNPDGLRVVLGKAHQCINGIQVDLPSGVRPLSANWASAQFPEDGKEELELTRLLLSRLDHAKRQSSGAGA